MAKCYFLQCCQRFQNLPYVLGFDKIYKRKNLQSLLLLTQGIDIKANSCKAETQEADFGLRRFRLL